MHTGRSTRRRWRPLVLASKVGGVVEAGVLLEMGGGGRSYAVVWVWVNKGLGSRSAGRPTAAPGSTQGSSLVPVQELRTRTASTLVEFQSRTVRHCKLRTGN